MRILHIHSDRKFISSSTALFSAAQLENTVVYLGESIKGEDAIICMPFTRKNASLLASRANEYDVVVFYSLRLEHAVICNMINKNVTIIWRFFGGELYQLMGRKMLSTESQEFYKEARFHHLLSVLKNTLLYYASAERIFKMAVTRTDYFMGLSDLEYRFLKQSFHDLPPFIQLPYIKEAPHAIAAKKDVVILGHSKDIYGNHLEILNGLISSQMMDNYSYVMFFSYGEYSKEYTRAVLNAASKSASIRVVSDFLSRSEYENITNTAAAMVINSYRQMGMGNVFQALRNGVKVYLNEKNVMYDWLVKEGFSVYTIGEFFVDICNRNVHLSTDLATKNIEVYNNLSVKYSVEDFCVRLLSLEK